MTTFQRIMNTENSTRIAHTVTPTTKALPLVPRQIMYDSQRNGVMAPTANCRMK